MTVFNHRGAFNNTINNTSVKNNNDNNKNKINNCWTSARAKRRKIGRENWGPMDPRKFGSDVSVWERTPNARTDSEGRGKKNSIGWRRESQSVPCVSFWRKINHFSGNQRSWSSEKSRLMFLVLDWLQNLPKKILRLCFFAWSRFWSRSRINLVSPPHRLVKIWPGEFMNENLCSIKCKDLARSKSEALVNIYILFERNVKACNAEQQRQRKRLKNW